MPYPDHIVVYGQSHANTWLEWFSQGLRRHGLNPRRQLNGYFAGAGLVVFWGHRQHTIIAAQKRVGCDYLVMERGYFNDRMKYTSLGFNGLNGRAEFYNDYSPPDRWAKHGVTMLPWKESGDYILILGQVAGDSSLEGVNIDAWYRDIAGQITAEFDLPIMFRPHPLSKAEPPGIPGVGISIGKSLQDDLAGAYFAVTFNSNSGVDAILSGTPVVACDEGSMVRGVSRPTIMQAHILYRPQRARWANDLAYCQWTAEEIKDGTAWDHLRQRYQ